MEKEKLLESLVDKFLQDNNEKIFAQILSLICEDVINLAYSFTYNLEDAKDIFQEVSLKIYRGLKKFKKRAKVTSWIYRITVNASIDYLRKRRSSSELKEEYIKSNDIISDIERKDKERILKKAVERLSPQQKKVFILKHYHHFKICKISQILGCSESSVKTHLTRAIENLRRLVKCV